MCNVAMSDIHCHQQLLLQTRFYDALLNLSLPDLKTINSKIFFIAVWTLSINVVKNCSYIIHKVLQWNNQLALWEQCFNSDKL